MTTTTETMTNQRSDQTSKFHPSTMPFEDITEYLEDIEEEGKTLDAYTFYKDIVGAYCILTKFIITDGKKIPLWICPKKNRPEDYPSTCYDAPFHLWGKEQVKAHNKWVKKNKANEITDFIAIPSATGKYGVIDVDDDKGMEYLKNINFPVEKAYHTKSVRKNKPHYVVATPFIWDKLVDTNKGIDFLSYCVFERLAGKVYGDTLYHLSEEDFCKIWTQYEYGGNNRPPFYNRIEHIERLNVPTMGQPKEPKIVSKKLKIFDVIPLPIGWRLSDTDNEIIPIDILNTLLSKLDYSQIDDYDSWKKLCIAVANNIPRHTDPNQYLDLFIKHSQKYPTYKNLNKNSQPPYDVENRDLFYWVMEQNKEDAPYNPKKIRSDYLWRLLKSHDKDAWKKLAFHKDRGLNAIDFAELTTAEGFAVFNKHISFIKSASPLYVEWCGQRNDYLMLTEDKLVKNYKHFATLEEKIDKKTGEVKGLSLSPKFVDKWVNWVGKKIYDDQTFAPPPKSVPYNHFNLYRGFRIDKVKDYNDIVNAMNKNELEEELEFLLNHLRILCGEDNTDAVYKWTLNLFAHLIKFPAILPRVMLIWVSLPGVGKNQFLNFMCNIIGDLYFTSSEKKEDFVGTFNDGISHKLLINLNELEGVSKVMPMIKCLITERTIGTTKKFQEKIYLPNCARMIGTTNRQYAVSVEDHDRRLMVVRCSPIIVNSSPEEKHEYNTKLASVVDDLFIQKCFTRYCREFVDVDKDYNFEYNRVHTREYTQMRRQSAPFSHRYFQFLYENGYATATAKYTKGKLFSIFNKQFTEECCEGNLKLNPQSHANMLENFVICATDGKGNQVEPSIHYLNNNKDKFIHKTQTDRYYYHLDPVRLKEFLTHNCYVFDEPVIFTDDEDDSDAESIQG